MSNIHRKLTRLVCPKCDLYTYSKLDGRCHNKGCNYNELQHQEIDKITNLPQSLVDWFDKTNIGK